MRTTIQSSERPRGVLELKGGPPQADWGLLSLNSLDSGCRLRSVPTQMALSWSLGTELAREGKGKLLHWSVFWCVTGGPCHPPCGG